MTEEQAKKTFERALKMEQEFGEYFTGMYCNFIEIKKKMTKQSKIQTKKLKLLN